MATIKAHDTFWQRRIIRGLQPILMEVLEVEERIGTRDICKVRWFVLSKDAAHESVFPMCTMEEGHFADFVPIPSEQYDKALGILNDTSIKNLSYTDDPPLVLTRKRAFIEISSSSFPLGPRKGNGGKTSVLA